MTIEKAKPKLLIRPITTGVFKANTKYHDHLMTRISSLGFSSLGMVSV